MAKSSRTTSDDLVLSTADLVIYTPTLRGSQRESKKLKRFKRTKRRRTGKICVLVLKKRLMRRHEENRNRGRKYNE